MSPWNYYMFVAMNESNMIDESNMINESNMIDDMIDELEIIDGVKDILLNLLRTKYSNIFDQSQIDHVNEIVEIIKVECCKKIKYIINDVFDMNNLDIYSSYTVTELSVYHVKIISCILLYINQNQIASIDADLINNLYIKYSDAQFVENIYSIVYLCSNDIFTYKMINKMIKIMNDSGNTECAVCMENIAGKYKYMGCGHSDVCILCTIKSKSNKCALCRSIITDVVEK